MAATHLIAARVSPETKERFRALAERQQVTESVLLKRLVDSVVDTVSQSDSEVLRSRQRPLRGSRLCVRLNSDDQWLLRERAAARQMAAATYVSVLVRSHLRTLSPLPRAELTTLTRSPGRPPYIVISLYRRNFRIRDRDELGESKRSSRGVRQPDRRASRTRAAPCDS